MLNLRPRHRIITSEIPSDSEDSSASENDDDVDSSDSEKSEESEDDNCDVDGWSSESIRFPCPTFDQATSGPKHNLNNDSSEYDFFKLLVTDDIINHLVYNTNLYSTQCENESSIAKNWEFVDADEMRAMIGLWIVMGIHQLPSIRDYWSTNPWLRVAKVADTMPRTRFEAVMHFLHANNNSHDLPHDDPNRDKIFKIRPILNQLSSRFLVHFNPYQALSIDESMIAFKGRSSIKQFMPVKPIKRGFKTWVLACPRTGYTFAFDPYTGKSGEPCTGGLGSSVVHRLVSLLPQKPGFIVHHDRYFTSVDLAEQLMVDGVYMCGTIMGNRKNFPRELTNKATIKQMKRGDVLVKQKGRMVAITWRDNKAINLLSTAYPALGGTTCLRRQKDGTQIEINCPPIVKCYNKGMGGVDLADQLVAYYPVGYHTKKWWPRFLFHFLSVAIVNAYILFKHQRGIGNMYTSRDSDAHKRFRLALADHLTKDFSSRKFKGAHAFMPTGNYNPTHHYEKLPGRINECNHCQKRLKEGNASPNRKRPRESYYGCKICCMHLCKRCYAILHRAT